MEADVGFLSSARGSRDDYIVLPDETRVGVPRRVSAEASKENQPT
jgi:hypothetical protein